MNPDFKKQKININYCKLTIDNIIMHIASFSEGIIAISYEKDENIFIDDLKKDFPMSIITHNREANSLYIKQLEEYFKGSRKEFTVPLYVVGTDFQKKVWKSLMEIPYGKVISYKDLANNIDNVKAVRAVGGANNKNRISIIIPCHRVVGSNKKLVGYGGGLSIKEKLLNIEGIIIEKEKVMI